MSDPRENKDNKSNEPPENMFRIVDDLLIHTNSSRRIFLIFIAAALIFAPIALVMGGILIGHPRYSIWRLEENHEEFGDNMTQNRYIPSTGTQFFIVEKNGSSVVREMPFHPPRQDMPIFGGIQAFIFISIIFAVVLLYIALKEYRFFAKWNTRYQKYKATQDKINDELGKD